jgi:alkylation response protein AidB-like acyl-CoA dehydrogenase
VTTDDLTELHDELRAVARELLGASGDGPPSRALLAGAGWLGLEVPEPLGGAGATFAEAAVVLEEMGREATPGPYPGTVVLGVGALGVGGAGDRRDALLGGIASGDTQVAVALGDAGAVVPEPGFRAEHTATGVTVHGGAAFVIDAIEADRLLLVARDDRGAMVLVDVAPDAAGLRIDAQPVLDETRSFGAVTAAAVTVDADAVLALRDLAPLADRAATAIAIDSLGLAAAMLDATVDHVATRVQFGRPIGSFQAVKHACAHMLVQVSMSRELVDAAVRAVAGEQTDAAVAVSMAKSYACDAAVAVVGRALQLHGGIGYTWEGGVHTYLKRATLNRSLFGSSRAHRARLAARWA